MPWKNGGGVSITIAAESEAGADPSDWRSVIWQFGRTSIVTPGPFSDLTGYERLQTVVVGRGLVLATNAGDVDLREPLTVRRYDGGLHIASRLEAGPVDVLNLIARRRACTVDLTILRTGETRDLPPGVHIVYAFGTAAHLVASKIDIVLATEHAARIDGAARLNCISGETVVASIALADNNSVRSEPAVESWATVRDQ
jgi:uncharacterized protein